MTYVPENMINYGKQTITEQDKQAVLDIFDTGYLTTGPAVPQFEKKVCNFTGFKYGPVPGPLPLAPSI